MIINSMDTDKNSDASFHACAEIQLGRIISISEEKIREGGEIWSESNKANGTASVCMQNAARDFPNFYKKVRKEAYRDSLPEFEVTQRMNRAIDARWIENEIESLERKLWAKKEELLKLRKEG